MWWNIEQMGFKGSKWLTKVIEKGRLNLDKWAKQIMASIICKHVNILNIGYTEWNKVKIAIIKKKIHKNKIFMVK